MQHDAEDVIAEKRKCQQNDAKKIVRSSRQAGKRHDFCLRRSSRKVVTVPHLLPRPDGAL